MPSGNSPEQLKPVVAWTLPKTTRAFLLFLIVSLFSLILYTDVKYPLGFDVPTLYLFPLILSILYSSKKLPFILAAIIPILCFVGALLSPQEK